MWSKDCKEPLVISIKTPTMIACSFFAIQQYHDKGMEIAIKERLTADVVWPGEIISVISLFKYCRRQGSEYFALLYYDS
jgi:hypothetical protein